MRRRRLIIGVAGALALAGCASGPGLTAAGNLATDHVGADAGQLVVAIGNRPGGPGTYYTSYTLVFQRADAPADGPVGTLSFKPGMWPTGDKPDYKLRDDVGVVLVASLPAGNYRIVDFGASTMVGNTAQHFSLKERIATPFRVEAGKLSYLGHYRASGQRGKNIFGMPLPAGVLWDIGSQAEADLALARARNTTKLLPDVIDLTPKAADVGSPAFRDRQAG
ncbi:hypothetical protein [Pelomonas sp. KK5]|uniref:hypothetical protein n=1 Tax=Pelomonas sp. KK5 TaxID=1855730 RepID=UPI00117C6BCC|nr:hypothetical protein [Pelomonas sp. KK5]